MKLNATGLKFTRENFRPWVWLAFPVAAMAIVIVLAFVFTFFLAAALIFWPIAPFIKWEVEEDEKKTLNGILHG